MPPKRARSASVAASAAGDAPAAPAAVNGVAASAPRRSSRVSIATAPPAAPRNPPRARVRRGASVLSAKTEASADDDEGASAAKKRRTATKKVVAAKKPREFKPLRAPIEGINPLPKRFALFPPHSAFTAAVAIPPVPAPEDAPRQVAIWGDGNFSGQLGMGDEPRDAPAPVGLRTLNKMTNAEEEGWTGGPADISAGGMHTLAVNGDGKVWTWGANDNAALGRITLNIPDTDNEELESVPMRVEDQDNSTVDSKHSGRPAHPFDVVRVAAGDSHSVALDVRGDVKAWGAFRNGQGLLGFSATTLHQFKPTALANLQKHSIAQVACGTDHYLALTTTGYVISAGVGAVGELGRRTFARNPAAGLTPERVISLKNIVLVGAGAFHSFAVDKDGEVYGWGNNTYRQTGVSEARGGAAMSIERPTVVDALSPAEHDGARVVQIACGAFHSLFLFSNGELWSVGRADEGECGLDQTRHPALAAMRARRVAAQAAQAEWRAKERAEYFAADGTTVEATNADGSLMTVAEIDSQVEQDAATECPLPNNYVPQPERVAFPLEPAVHVPNKTQAMYDAEPDQSKLALTEATQIVHVASAGQHNIAVSARGYVYTWGLGLVGQLGHGRDSPSNEWTPRRVLNRALSQMRVLSASAGGQHVLVTGIHRAWEDKKEERDEARQAKAAADKARREADEAAARKAHEDKDAAAPVENGIAPEADGGDVEMGDAVVEDEAAAAAVDAAEEKGEPAAATVEA
ncbi:hypothetical protein JCM3770_001346 [Rhodotorula araucariae]